MKVPPRWADKFLEWYCNPELLEDLQGDLHERFNRRITHRGAFIARLMFVVDVLSFLRPYTLKRNNHDHNPVIMSGHYLRNFMRNFSRNKAYSFMTIFSLVIGMGACLTISQYIFFELSYDRFHNDYQNKYRVIIKETNTDLKETSPLIGYSFGQYAKEEIPEVRAFVRQQRFNRGAVVTNQITGRTFHEEVNDLLFVDDSFFDVFNFPLSRGDRKFLFNNRYNVVITESTADKYFGDDDPIGQTLRIDGSPSPGDYTVTGVLKNPPLNSHLQFEFLMPIDNYIELGWGGAVKERGGWNGFSVATYLTVDGSADLDLVRAKLNELIANHSDNTVTRDVILQPISDIYMKSGDYSDPGFINTIGNMQNIRIFSVVSIFILLIAWGNYINLSTALSMLRAKEVGVRKSVGALRKQLIGQFILESILTNAVSALLAIGVAFWLLPILGDIVGKDIPLSLPLQPLFWFSLLLLVLVGSLLSGLYPAFVLSSFKPISMLGSGKSIRTGKVSLRRGLIVFQFLASLLLISGTYLVFKQTSFMMDQKLNIHLEQVLILRNQQGAANEDVARSNFDAFGNALKDLHVVSAITSSTVIPGQFGVNPYRRAEQPASAIPYSRSIFANRDFLDTYGLKIISGATFNGDAKVEQVIINQAAIKAFGFESPEDAINQTLMIGDNQRVIVGVVEDFDWHSLKEHEVPYVIDRTDVTMTPYFSIRIITSDFAGTLAQIESKFHSFYPGQPFEYFFADESFNRQYQSEVQFGKVFFSFSSLAIIIACVGLFALVSFSANLRIKEISIRKILGAEVRSLAMLLSGEYAMLISVAMLVAAPVIWYWSDVWLSGYATQVPIGVDLFVIPLIIVIAIATLTVGGKIYTTVQQNPVDCLRKE